MIRLPPSIVGVPLRMQWALAGKWGVHNCVVLGSWGSICSWGSVPDHIKHLKFKIKLKSIGWSWKAPNASILHMLKSFFEANCTFLFPMCFVCVCTRMCARTCLWRPQFVNCFTSPPSSLSLFPPLSHWTLNSPTVYIFWPVNPWDLHVSVPKHCTVVHSRCTAPIQVFPWISGIQAQVLRLSQHFSRFLFPTLK